VGHSEEGVVRGPHKWSHPETLRWVSEIMSSQTSSCLSCLAFHKNYFIVVKALCYKPEGRGFETWWGEWFLSIYLILPVAPGPRICSASNRSEYQR
jgi:hypothetical protein